MSDWYRTWLTVALGIILLLPGCGTPDYAPVDTNLVSQIENGSKLSDAIDLLGEFHPPTSVQTEAINGLIANMPDRVRENAEKDQKVAWGNDKTFLIVVVNEEGQIWAQSHRK